MDLNKLGTYTPALLRDTTCHEAAVLIPLIETSEGYDVLFEVRSSKIAEQPGDICFPGGVMEEGEGRTQAAVRETCEELLTKPEQIEILGPSDFFHNFGIVIYPSVGILKDYDGGFSTDEVSEVFRVPLSFFMKNEPEFHCNEWVVKYDPSFPYELVNGGKDYKWRKMIQEHPFYFYDDRVIWGITARMLYGFIKVLKSTD
ncbi:MAG: CoA pyrophosphatase [Eubacteriaceae bacterium]|nr:CoA pyrophosphatase [Eubacteriaceae bacterium]